MLYVQFYSMSTGYIPGSSPPRFDPAYSVPIEACGDRGVIIVDGRLNPERIMRIAREECKKRGFVGLRIFRGESFTRSLPVSTFFSLQGAE